MQQRRDQVAHWEKSNELQAPYLKSAFDKVQAEIVFNEIDRRLRQARVKVGRIDPNDPKDLEAQQKHFNL